MKHYVYHRWSVLFLVGTVLFMGACKGSDVTTASSDGDPVVAALRALENLDERYKPIDEQPVGERQRKYCGHIVMDASEPQVQLGECRNTLKEIWNEIRCDRTRDCPRNGGVVLQPELNMDVQQLRPVALQVWMDQAEEVLQFASSSEMNRALDRLATRSAMLRALDMLKSNGIELTEALDEFLEGVRASTLIDMFKRDFVTSFDQSQIEYAEARSELLVVKAIITKYQEQAEAHRAPLDEILSKFQMFREESQLLMQELSDVLSTASATDDEGTLVQLQEQVRGLDNAEYHRAVELQRDVARLNSWLKLLDQYYNAELNPHRTYLAQHELEAPPLFDSPIRVLSNILAFASDHYNRVRGALNSVIHKLEMRRDALRRSRTAQHTNSNDDTAQYVERRAGFLRYVQTMVSSLNHDGEESPIPGMQYQERIYQRLVEFEKFAQSCVQDSISLPWQETGCNLAEEHRARVEAELRHFPTRLKLYVRQLQTQNLVASNEVVTRVVELSERGYVADAVAVYDKILAAGLTQED